MNVVDAFVRGIDLNNILCQYTGLAPITFYINEGVLAADLGYRDSIQRFLVVTPEHNGISHFKMLRAKTQSENANLVPPGSSAALILIYAIAQLIMYEDEDWAFIEPSKYDTHITLKKHWEGEAHTITITAGLFSSSHQYLRIQTTPPELAQTIKPIYTKWLNPEKTA